MKGSASGRLNETPNSQDANAQDSSSQIGSYGVGRWAVLLAAAYLAAHLPSLAPSLEDIDSINFALGLRDFDPARHQPHPPGSPVYIAFGRALLAIVSVIGPTLGQTWGQTTVEALTLSLWSGLAGAVALFAAVRLFDEAAPHHRGAAWGAALLAACPLYWLSGLRPMSDLPGLAAALISQVLILQGRRERPRLTAGAFVAGLAAGIRVQTVWLTLPLLALALIHQRRAGLVWMLRRPVAALAAAGLAWVIPLVIDSGGLEGYLRALGTQAGEDFAWVNMLWLEPTPRRLMFALYETFVLPWGGDALAAIIAIAAVIGGGVAFVRDRRTVAILLVAFGPYTALHLLFQETLTVRYALPTLVPVVWLAARALSSAGRFAHLLAVPLVTAALVVS